MQQEGKRHLETWRIGALALLAFATMLPVTLPVPVLRELIQDRFAVSELLTSLFMSINMVGAAFAAPLAGVLADRFGRRPALIAGALGADALCFVALSRAESFEAFMAIRLVEGAAHILALSLLLSLASGARGPKQRGRVLGVVGGAMMLGVGVGAPIGGAAGRDDPLAPLGLAAVLAGVAALLAAAVLREHGAAGGARPGWREIAALVRQRRILLAPLLFAFVDRFTVGFYTTTLTLFLRRVHDLPADRIGLLMAVFLLPFALFSWPFGWLAERTSRTALLCGGSLLYGVGTASLTFWPPAALPLVMAGIGVTAAVMFVPSMLLTTQIASERVRSTALGSFNAAGSLGFIVGPITGGLVTQWVAGATGDWAIGYRTAFAVAGATEIAIALLAFPLLWRWERCRFSRG